MSASRRMTGLFKAAVGSIMLAALNASVHAVPVTYSGYDLGAGSLATAPNATAAAAAFDTALPGLSIIDFENAITPGFSVTGDGSRRNTLQCPAALCGYNTTVGGSWFLDATFNTAFNFTTAIDSFGAYFTGVQRADATLTYTDGTTTTLTLPAASLGSGGTTFFGFSDSGATILSIAFFTGTGGDFVGIDDIRYGTAGTTPVPEPATLSLLGVGLLGFGLMRRRRRAV